jgi:hypothetical protein
MSDTGCAHSEQNFMMTIRVVVMLSARRLTGYDARDVLKNDRA